MKTLLLILALFLSFSTYAQNPQYAVVMKYQLASEREGGKELRKDEIASVTWYEYNCITNIRIKETIKLTDHIQPGQKFSAHYMFSDNNPACFRGVITDTEGRASALSEIFKAWDFRTPKSVECEL